MINEARRRGRVTGTDLLPRFARVAPLDLFGMGAGALRGVENLAVIENLHQELLHRELARRRVYLHPIRWTSLGLSLIEAMQLGMPVVALATTEVPEAVSPQAGFVSSDVDALAAAVRRLIRDPDEAKELGRAARRTALERYGLERFLADWDRLLEEVTG